MSDQITDPRSASAILQRLRWNAVRHWIYRRDFVLLLGIALIAGGIWFFVELSEDIVEGEQFAFDSAILLAMRNPADVSDPLGPYWVEEAMRDFTGLGGSALLTLITFGVVFFLWLQSKSKMALYLFVSVAGGAVISTVLKELFQRPRPDLVPHGSYTVTASFPSGHSMLSAVVFLTLGALIARMMDRQRMRIYVIGWAAFITFLVGVSRIYLGVHWPTDVLAGWAAGAAWALLCMIVARWLQQRGAVESADGETANSLDEVSVAVDTSESPTSSVAGAGE